VSAPVALVTGSSRGIGRAIAIRLAADGYCVVVNYLSNEAAGEEVRDVIRARGGTCLLKGFDISKRAQVTAAIHEVTAAVGPISVLVNNAATARYLRMKSATEFLRPIWNMADEDWDEVIDTNLTGAYNCTKPVVKIMLEKKLPRGRIINIGSTIADFGLTFMDHYSAAKSGLVGFTKSLARALATKKITVTAVAPGFILTEATASVPAEPYLASIPLGRVGLPEEVAATVSFLASDRAAYITGQVIRVDGGMYM
jgi:3-oxoacyl-[acyl-carrier protein] reductase